MHPNRISIFLTLAVAISAAQTNAQGTRSAKKEVTAEELRARYEAELAEPFVAKGGWIVDYDDARAQAKREGKLIFTYFSRSYAG